MLKQLTFLGGLLSLFLWHANAAEATAVWKPQNWSGFYFIPEQEHNFSLENLSMAPSSTIKYEIRDYVDKVVHRGEGVISDHHTLDIPLRLPKGYYEVSLLGQKRIFRLFCGAEFTEQRDSFFGIDGAYSWFPAGEKEPAMMNALSVHGVHTVRERFSYRQIQEELDAGRGWDVGVAKRYCDVRKRLKDQRLRVMDCFHDAPASRGGNPKAWNSGNYPTDLIGVAKDWKSIFPHLGRMDDSIELWNEPDGFSMGPASLYVPLVKALGWSYAESRANMMLIGGIFSELAPASFLDSAADNGLFDYVDAISFHTYSGPVEVEKQIRGYRDLFKKHNREGMLLFITEAGRPFSRDTWWDQGNAACWIIAKGVVARACGLAGYYPFLAQSYAQGEMNFSMIDPDSAPRRSLAAYLNMISELSNMQYVGNLKHVDPKIITCVVFRDETRMVAVPITLNVQAENIISLNAPITAIRGIDGRLLAMTADKCIPIPDGIAYLELDVQKMGAENSDYLKSDTSYMELYQRAKLPLSPKRVAPVVLAFKPDPTSILCSEHRLDGFQVDKRQISEFRFTVKASNLSSNSVKGTLNMVPPTNGVARGEANLNLEIPPQSSVPVAFSLDLSKCTGDSGTVVVRFEGTEGLCDMVIPTLIWNTEQKSYRAPSRGSLIRIDGVVTPEEWGKTEPITIGNAEFDVTARFAWGTTGFYFAYEVQDAKHLQSRGAGTAWQEDSIQMAFADGKKKYEYGISLAGNKAQWSRWIAPETARPLPEDTPLRILRNEESKVTTYEGMLPWDAIVPIKGESNTSFRFTFCVNNLTENGEKRVIEWTQGITSGGKNPELFGVVQLYDNME